MSSRHPFHHSLIYFAAAAAVLLITPATADTDTEYHARCLMQIEPWHPQNTPHVLIPAGLYDNVAPLDWYQGAWWAGLDSVSAQVMDNGYLVWKDGMWLYGSVDAPIAYVKQQEGYSFTGGELCFYDNLELIRISDGTHFGLLLQLEAPYLTTCPPMRGVPTAHEQRNVVTFEGITPNSLRDCVAHVATRVDVESIKSVVYHSETKLCSGIKYEDPTNRTLDSSSESSDLFCDIKCFPIPGMLYSTDGWIETKPIARNWSGTLDECVELVKRHYKSASAAAVFLETCEAGFRMSGILLSIHNDYNNCFIMPTPSPQVPFEECFMQTDGFTSKTGEIFPPSLLIPMAEKPGTTDRTWCVYDNELKRCSDVHLVYIGHSWVFKNQTDGTDHGRLYSTTADNVCSRYSGDETCFDDKTMIYATSCKAASTSGHLYRLSEPYYTSCPPSQGYVSWTDTAVITDFKDDSFFPTSLRDCVAYARAHYEPARFASVAFNKEEGLCNGSDQPPTPEEGGAGVSLRDYCNFGCTPILGMPKSGDLLPVSTSTEVPVSTSTEVPVSTSTEVPVPTSTEVPVPTGTVVRGSEACYMNALETYENVMGVMFEGDSCYGVPEFLGGLYDETASTSWCYNHQYDSTTTPPPPTTPPPTTTPPTTSPTSPTESDDVDYSSSAFMPMNNIKAATAVTTIAVAVAAVVA